MIKKVSIIIISILLLSALSIIIIFSIKTNKQTDQIEQNQDYECNCEEEKIITKEELNITKIKNTTYTFNYKNEIFQAIYTKDNWKIIDSYKITNTNDIVIICESLIEIHQVHGKDMISYRTATDMAYEWLQHNIAYQLLPEGHDLKNNAKDVDLDPKDQGKNFKEIYEDRTGKELDLSNLGM